MKSAQLCVNHMEFGKSDYLGRVGADQSRDQEPSFRGVRSASRNGSDHFQSMILLMSPSNSMPQNAPPW